MKALELWHKVQHAADDAQVLVLAGGRYVRVDDVQFAHAAPDTAAIYKPTSICFNGDELVSVKSLEAAIKLLPEVEDGSTRIERDEVLNAIARLRV